MNSDWHKKWTKLIINKKNIVKISQENALLDGFYFLRFDLLFGEFIIYIIVTYLQYELNVPCI